MASTNHGHEHESERYSARQDAKLKMGGVIGEATYEGDLTPFLRLLALGEVLHVGKGTGLGLGKYRVSAEHNTMGDGASHTG